MRLFTGISICPIVCNRLSRLLDHLRPTAQIKWSPIYNLHLTTKFIGAWPEEKLQDAIQALREVPTPKPFEITINGVGWLPNPHHPQTLFAKVRAPEALVQLVGATNERMLRLGIPLETRPYTSHITLARIRIANPLTELKQTIAALPSVDFGSFTVTQYHLFESCPGPACSVYTRLADFPLSAQ